MSGQYDPRITAYFGDAVLQAGFMPVPNLFLRHYAQLDITTPQAMFLLQLMAIAWDVGSPPTNMTRRAVTKHRTPDRQDCQPIKTPYQDGTTFRTQIVIFSSPSFETRRGSAL